MLNWQNIIEKEDIGEDDYEYGKEGEEYRRIMTIKEFEEYKKDWIKNN